MATVKKPSPLVQRSASMGKALSAIPETAGVKTEKRKRLAKVFKRPLDKTLRTVQLVREKFSIPEAEYEQLLELKQRLAEQGLMVKKSELLRAGLQLLVALDADQMKTMLADIQAAS